MGILVISYDAVGDKVFEAMAGDREKYPNAARFRDSAFYRGGVKTVFLSNTYPVHTSIATGRLPKDHGIISNLLPPKQSGERPWAQMAKLIKRKTIWDAAREKNLTTAAMLWPVTNGAKIDYHMPEVHPEKGQSMLLRSLLYGSFFFQTAALLKHGKKLLKALKGIADGTALPSLDDFTAAVTRDMLKKRKPDLVLVHLIGYDTMFHFAGAKGTEAIMKNMDDNLGMLLDSWGDDTVILFSDHSQLEVIENIDLDAIYGKAVYEQAGGCAFLNSKTDALEEQPWFERYLSPDEMDESGYADKPVLGIAAKQGYAFVEGKKYLGNHGYPLDYPNYNVFYGVKGKNFPPDKEQPWLKNRITDVTAIIAKELSLDMDIL